MPTIEEIRAFPEYETKDLGRDSIYARPEDEQGPLLDALRQSEGWQNREHARLNGCPGADKIYKRLPPIWYDWLLPMHYAHRSKKDDSQIAFTKTTRKGLQDVQTRMKPGRYLQEYYSDRFSPDDIKDLVRELTPCEYTMARTPAEIARVYENGPNSCMSGIHWYSQYASVIDRPLNGDDDHANPVGVYATKDVAVAYIQKGDRITARAVVNMRDRKFARVYGDVRLHDALVEDGFTNETDALVGCRLRKVPIRHDNAHYYLMPYLDSASYVIERGDFLVAMNQYCEAYTRWESRASELITMGGTTPFSGRIMVCELTGERASRTLSAFRVASVEAGGVRVEVGPNGRAIYLRRVSVAAHLVESLTWQHVSGRRIVSEPNHASVVLDNGNRMFAEEARHFSARCWLTNRLLPTASLMEACVGYTLNDDGTVAFDIQKVVDNAAFYCEFSGRWWAITEQTCMANGQVLSKYALSQRKNIVTDEYTGLPWPLSNSVRLAGSAPRYARRSIFHRTGYSDAEGRKYLSYRHYLQSQQGTLPMAAE